MLHKIRAAGEEKHTKLTLLGIKWLPTLTRFQGQELSPYEVGERLFFSSVDALVSSPALVSVLKGTEAIASLRKLIPQTDPHDLTVLISPTPEVALRQSSVVFFDHEMIQSVSEDQQMLLSVCLIEPKVWSHSIISSVLQQSGLTLVGLQIVNPPTNDHPRRQSGDGVGSGSFVALCLKGENAVQRLLDARNHEDSTQWKTFYASGSFQEAISDVRRFFPEGLCCSETIIMRQEEIQSLCSDHLASGEHGSFTQEGLPVAAIPNKGRPENCWQTICLLLPSNDPTHSKVQLLEELLMSGCHLEAGRLTVLDLEQWTQVAETICWSSRGSHGMTESPCLIVALAGERIVADFDLILKRAFKKRPDLEKLGGMLLYSASEEEARQLMSYLFGSLSSESFPMNI